MSYAVPIYGYIIGIPLLVVGSVLLVLWFVLRKDFRTRTSQVVILLVLLIVVIIGGALFASNILYIYMMEEDMRHVEFEYNAVLEVNGNGRASVSIPMPTAQWLWSNLQVTPSTSTVSVNDSGPEPAFEVILSENTTLHATAYGERSIVPEELTRTSDSSCYHQCSSEVSMQMLEGNITGVKVTLEVYWSSPCHASNWLLECIAVPGQFVYTGEWMTVVC